MKKSLIFAAAMAVSGTVSAQGPYAGLNVGYGFGAPGSELGSTINATASSYSETAIYSSLGGGVNAGLNVGYMFSEHIGADLGLNYFMGSTVRSSDVTSPSGTVTVDSKSSQMRISPSIIVSTGGTFAGYARFGLVLPVGGSTVTEYRDNTSGTEVAIDYESKGMPSLGFQGAVGVDYSLSDKLSLFGEFSPIVMQIKSKSRSTTAYTVGGQDQMGNLTTYEKEQVSVDELTNSSNNFGTNPNASDAAAQDVLASSTNYNGAFISVGLKFRF